MNVQVFVKAPRLSLGGDLYCMVEAIKIRVGNTNGRPEMQYIFAAEGLYCKRPVQCMASSKILTPYPLHCLASVYPPPRHLCGGRTLSLGGEGVGGQ